MENVERESLDSRLNGILKSSPVPGDVVLKYLSRGYSVGLPARVRLVYSYIKKLAELPETASPADKKRLHESAASEAYLLMVYRDAMASNDVLGIGKIAVDSYAELNNWEGAFNAAAQSGHPEVVQYAAKMAQEKNAPEKIVYWLLREDALLNGRLDEALRMVAEAGDYSEGLNYLLVSVPEDKRSTIKDQLWLAAKQGKLPLEAALRLAHERGEKGMEAILAEAALATTKSSLDKAVIAKDYGLSDLGQYLLGAAAELRQETAELRKMLEANPAQVVKKLEFLYNWRYVINYSTHPEQSKQLDAAIKEAEVLETDALMLTGDFEKAIWTARRCNHPQANWLSKVFQLAKERPQNSS